MTYIRYLLYFFALLHISFQRSTPQDSHYVAAVVEYEVSNDVEQNRLNYIGHIAEAARQNADIVVFPELTLTNRTTSLTVPMHGLLQQYPVPALHPELYDSLLVSMSAAARDNKIYVVLNTRELMDCTRNDTGEDCPELKEYIFNTNVVFDRNGTVIDRYRKINLFGEYAHTPALQPDLGYFNTDFGVAFGHFICFDLMFQVPAVQVVQKREVTDVIFTTMWFSELPYLTAVEIQEAYAYKMNVNFIASGANNVALGSAGSGIYSGKAGALVSIMPGVATTRLLVSRVPKVPGEVSGESYPGPIYDNPSDHDGLKLITDPSLVSHISRPLVQGFQEFTLVDKDVSCHFKVRLNQAGGDIYPHYRAIVHDGTNTYARREIGIASCSVVACKTNEFKSCGYRYGDKTENNEIQDLEIAMTTYQSQYNTTLDCDNIVYFPLSVRDNKFPLGPVNYTFLDEKQNEVIDSHYGVEIQNEVHLENESSTRLIFKLNKPQKDLVAFAIWGRIFSRDIDHNKHITEEDKKQFMDILNIIYGNDGASGDQREKLSSLANDHKKEL